MQADWVRASLSRSSRAAGFFARWLLLFIAGELVLLAPVVPMVVADHVFFGEIGRATTLWLFGPFALWSAMCVCAGWIFVALRRRILQARPTFIRWGFLGPLAALLVPAVLIFCFLAFQPDTSGWALLGSVLVSAVFYALSVVFVGVTTIVYVIGARLTGLLDWS